MASYYENTFSDRKPLLEIPKGFIEVEGSRTMSPRFEAEAQAEYATFQRETRVAEPCALVIGAEVRQIVTTDPGELTFYTLNRVGNLKNRFDTSFALNFSEGAFRDSRNEPLGSGAEIITALKRAKDAGFSDKEITTAFGQDEALEAVRLAAVEVVKVHTAGLFGRPLVDYYKRAAELDVLPGFEAADLGVMADEVFEEEIKKTILGADLPDVLDLVEALVA